MIETWNFDGLNTIPSDQTTLANQCSSCWWDFVTLITAAGDGAWTIESSSGWGSFGALTWATGTNTHSWICLKSPVGIVAGNDGSYLGDQSCIWLTIDLNYATASATVKTKFHRTVPTGGTSTAAPTSTYQLSWYADTQFLRTTYAGTARWNFQRTNKGNFIFDINYLSTGYPSFTLSSLPVTDVMKQNQDIAGKDYPYAMVLFSRWNDGILYGIGAWGNFITPTVNSTSYDNILAQTSPMGTLNVLGWAADGAIATMKLGFMAYSQYSAVSGWNAVVAHMIGEIIPKEGDVWVGKNKLGSEVPVICSTTGKVAPVGILSDITCAGGLYNQGAVDDRTNIQYRYNGSLWMPANVKVSL